MSDEEYAFLPYQVRWASETHPVVIAEKSRRIGFTWGTAALCALNAMSSNGRDSWYVGYNRAMSAEFINDCAYWTEVFHGGLEALEMGDLIYPHGKREECIFTYQLRYASGHKIVALSSRPSELRGKGGDVIIDEAAFHRDLAELMKSAMALTIQGARVMVISTHDGDLNPFQRNRCLG